MGAFIPARFSIWLYWALRRQKARRKGRKGPVHALRGGPVGDTRGGGGRGQTGDGAGPSGQPGAAGRRDGLEGLYEAVRSDRPGKRSVESRRHLPPERWATGYARHAHATPLQIARASRSPSAIAVKVGFANPVLGYTAAPAT